MVEAVVWRVPVPVGPSGHAYKYRLAYIVDGQTVVGFGNERGKGDHCHIGGIQRSYRLSVCASSSRLLPAGSRKAVR